MPCPLYYMGWGVGFVEHIKLSWGSLLASEKVWIPPLKSIYMATLVSEILMFWGWKSHFLKCVKYIFKGYPNNLSLGKGPVIIWLKACSLHVRQCDWSNSYWYLIVLVDVAVTVEKCVYFLENKYFWTFQTQIKQSCATHYTHYRPTLCHGLHCLTVEQALNVMLYQCLHEQENK